MKKKVIAYLHTHWDREWYREFEIFRLRLLRVFDNVLDLLENKKIPKDIEYDKVPNLASEARIKLKQVHPRTIAQASRISGVNPVDISVLSIYLKKEYPHE